MPLLLISCRLHLPEGFIFKLRGLALQNISRQAFTTIALLLLLHTSYSVATKTSELIEASNSLLSLATHYNITVNI
jgi:ABC-type transporter Mla MlaB component